MPKAPYFGQLASRIRPSGPSLRPSHRSWRQVDDLANSTAPDTSAIQIQMHDHSVKEISPVPVRPSVPFGQIPPQNSEQKRKNLFADGTSEFTSVPPAPKFLPPENFSHQVRGIDESSNAIRTAQLPQKSTDSLPIEEAPPASLTVKQKRSVMSIDTDSHSDTHAKSERVSRGPTPFLRPVVADALRQARSLSAESEPAGITKKQSPKHVAPTIIGNPVDHNSSVTQRSPLLNPTMMTRPVAPNTASAQTQPKEGKTITIGAIDIQIVPSNPTQTQPNPISRSINSGTRALSRGFTSTIGLRQG